MTILVELLEDSFLFRNYAETVEVSEDVWTPRSPRAVLEGAEPWGWEPQEEYPIGYLEFVDGSGFFPVYDEEDAEVVLDAKVGDIFHWHGTCWKGDSNWKVLAVRLKDGWHMGEITHDGEHLSALRSEEVDINHLMEGTANVSGECFNGCMGTFGIWGKVFRKGSEEPIWFQSCEGHWRSGNSYIGERDTFPTHTEEELRELFLHTDTSSVDVEEVGNNNTYRQVWERNSRGSWFYRSWYV